MGVLNVTPDSFSDGGTWLEPERARAHIDELLEQGTDIIDIGGESSRPGFTPVPIDEQIRRTLDPIRHAVKQGVPVSIDTTAPEVARAALDAGATMVNDVMCLRAGPALAEVVAQHGAWLILMHSRAPMTEASGYAGTPDSAYGDVVVDVTAEWLTSEAMAERAGVPRDRILFDPGIGFNKNARHSAELVARLSEFSSLRFPIVVGPSRKSFLAADVPTPPSRRLGGTVAASLACAARGATMLRVHDVLEVRQALAVARRVDLPAGIDRAEVHHA